MNHLYKFMITIALLFGALIGVSAEDTSVDKLERIVQKLVMPPLLPVHEQVATGEPKIVQIRMVIEEKLIEVDQNGAKIWAMTFNGSVPGPIIVVHQDDYVELTLVNPKTNTLQHNIDFHATTGALGGGRLIHKPVCLILDRNAGHANHPVRFPVHLNGT